MKKLFILLFCFFGLSSVTAQEARTVSADQISANFWEQARLFPQEKIHMHTDKPSYVVGEKIWFRLFLVNALSHFPESASRYIYTELVNPLDEVVQRVKIRPDADSLFHGYLALEDSLPGGIYTLRAYTGFMRNLDDDYFFRKTVQIISPLAKSVQPEAIFDYTPDNSKVTAHIRFRDVENNITLRPQTVTVSTEKGPLIASWEAKDSTFRVKFGLEDYRHRVMLVEFGNCRQYIPVTVADETYNISFFPEGGHLLLGTACRVAFKVLQPGGLSESVAGVIVEEGGDTITKIRSMHKGMGFFDFTPEPGKKYYADCTNAAGVPGRFNLPEAVNGGHSLKVTNVNDKLYVSVLHSSDITTSDSLFLLIHLRGIVEYADWWNPANESMFFTKKDFPSGMSHVLLLDKKGNTLSERLVFIYGEDQAVTAFEPDQPEYKSRERVHAKVKVADAAGNPLTGNFSVSVTDNKDVQADTTRTILSTLLFSSELRGYIEDPEFYIRKNDPASRMALDILLMTQGWRRYPVPDVVNGKLTRPLYPLEAGQCISGYVKSLFRNKMLNRSTLNLLSPDASYVGAAESDSTGRFMFCGFEFPDSTHYLVHAFSEKGKQNVELQLDSDTFPEVKQRVPLYGEPLNAAFSLQYIQKSDQRITYQSGIRNTFLEEVVIVGKKKSKSAYQDVSSKSITSQQLQKYGNTSVKTVLMGIPGVFVVGDKISFRGTGTLKFLLDGYLMEDPSLIESTLNSMNLDEIEQIDLIKGGATMVYSVSGADAIIAITTKMGDLNRKPEPRFNVGFIMPLGYQKPEAFYAPVYETEKQKLDMIPDLRTTIHWEPNVKVLPDGTASFQFYTADMLTDYSVVIEGISRDGKIIRRVEQLHVK